MMYFAASTHQVLYHSIYIYYHQVSKDALICNYNALNTGKLGVGKKLKCLRHDVLWTKMFKNANDSC